MSEHFIHCAKTPLFFSQANHDAIIQTLERHLGYDEDWYPLYFPTDVYASALDTVNDARIIFTSGIHPDFDQYEINPEQAVRDVGGRFAGYLTNARIDTIGHPTACATLALDSDPDIEQLIKEGKLSVSPSVGVTRDEAGDIIKMKFQNLLVFPETPGGMAVPGDPGTKILNSKKNPKYNPSQIDDNLNENSGSTMTEKTVIETVEKPVIDPAITAQIKEMAAQFTAFQNKTNDLETQLKAKDEALAKEKEAFAQFTAKIEADKVAAKELEFMGLIHDPLFPEGMLKAENAEAELKAEFQASPAQFTRRILSVYAAQNAFLGKHGKEEGQQFSSQKKEDGLSAEARELYKKLGAKEEFLNRVI
jgi:hypothetical protein